MNWMSDKIDKIAPALLAAQKTIKGAKKDSTNPHLKNKYADLGSVFDACKDELNAQGIVIMQPMGTQGDRNTLRTLLLHESGQYFAAEALLPNIDQKGINAAQAMGSAISYMRRYQLSGLAGVLQTDDDGNAAKQPEPEPGKAAEPSITLDALLDKIAEAKAMKHLKNIWDKYGADMAKFSPPVQAELAKAKNDKKMEIAKAAADPTLADDYEPPAGEQGSLVPDDNPNNEPE